jgi:hypothetical protein
MSNLGNLLEISLESKKAPSDWHQKGLNFE